VDVTVIVCTRNRASALQSCLESISTAIAQAPNTLAEAIVVDNGSTDNTHAVILGWMRSAPYPTRVVDELKPGLGAARNAGVEWARGTFIVFTDDDCRLAPDYLCKMLAHFANDGEPVIRGGRVELGDPTDMPAAIKTWSSEVRLEYPMHPGVIALGCNMVINRQVFERIGLFDERFGAGTTLRAGEEVEYFYRAFLNGVPVIYVPDMIVFHFHGRKTLEAVRRQLVNYAIGTGAMAAKHVSTGTLLSKHVYWDLRKALREMVVGSGASRWNGSSEMSWMLGIVRGAALFWAHALIAKLSSADPHSLNGRASCELNRDKL
jgi:GT2 family glycosyltransferase